MDETYSVSTNNRFALFMDEEDDPGDVVLQESKLPEKSPKKVEAPIQKKTEKVAKIKETKEKPLGQQNKRSQGEVAGKRKDPSSSEKSPTKEKSGDRLPRGNTGGGGGGLRDNRRIQGGGNNFGDRGSDNRPPRQIRNRGRLPSRENQEGQGGQTSGYDDGTQRDSRSRPRWGERNRDRGERDDKEGERPFRPPRSNRGGFRGGKREFERRSGSDKTSVKAMDKREGAGAHNWGTVKDDMNTSSNDWPTDENEQPTELDAQIQPPDLDKENSTEEQEQEKEQEQPKEVEEDKEKEKTEDTVEMTLDEYKALQEKKRFVPSFKERKPGENEDSTRWKHTFVYERTDQEFFPGTREVVEKYKTSGRVKTSLESSFFFKDISRRGGATGGSGGRRDDKRGPDDRDRRSERRQFEDRRGPDDRERRPERRQFEDRRGPDDNRDRRPDRRQSDEKRRYEDRRRPGRGRDRSNFNVEDEKDFPSLGTVSA